MKNIPSESGDELSFLEIGGAIVFGILLFLLFCQLGIDSNQKLMSQYTMLPETHEYIMNMCRFYKSMLEIFKEFINIYPPKYFENIKFQIAHT